MTHKDVEQRASGYEQAESAATKRSPSQGSTLVNRPEAALMISNLQNPVAGIVTLAAVRARNEAPDMHSFAVEIFGNGEREPATAGD